jgi:hypothetical protein
MEDEKYKKIEYPPGYLDAYQKYNIDNLNFEQPLDSPADIWEQLEDWRDYEKGYPGLLEKFSADSPFYRQVLESGAADIEKFKARLLKAAFDGDRAYFENLLKVMDYDSWPEPEMHGIRAALQVFDALFIGESKNDWPTKREVRARAEEILKAAGKAVPKKHAWTRILRKAGLGALKPARAGRPTKR